MVEMQIDNLPVLPSDYFSDRYTVTVTAPVQLQFDVGKNLQRNGRRGYIANDSSATSEMIVKINNGDDIPVKNGEKLEFAQLRVQVITVSCVAGTIPIRVFVV